jgi:outer membrane protein
MKNIRIFSCFASILVLSPLAASAQNLKIGTVDMKRVFESYYKTKDAEAKINEKRNSAKKELEDRMDVEKKALEEIKKLDEDIQKPELSKPAKEEKMRLRQEKAVDLQNMDREIREFQTTQEKQLNELSVRMRGGIVEEINKVVEARVKAENFDLVLDKSGQSLNGVPLVLYSRDNWDFTTEVVTALNKNRNSSSDLPAPAPTATPRSRKGGN